MADGVFNIAKGKVNELVTRVDDDDPTDAAIVLVLLKTSAEADATLEDYATLALLLAGSNTEANFTNYARAVLTSTVPSTSVDNTNNWATADLPNTTWSSAGGTLDNTLVKMIVCYDPDSTIGDDTTLVPLTHHDFDVTTDGNDLTATFHLDGFYKAA